jgi:Ca2+-binding EF-hand superfamily protein
MNPVFSPRSAGAPYIGFNFGRQSGRSVSGSRSAAPEEATMQQLLRLWIDLLYRLKGPDMKIKTALIAAIAGVFAVTATAPAFAAKDPAKKEKRINRMIKRADLNGDGKISESELARGIAVTFAALDINRDGALSADEISNAKATMKAHRKQARAAGEGRLHFVKFPAKKITKRFDKIDANGDGKLSESELTRVSERMFKKRDKNNDGYITTADFKR